MSESNLLVQVQDGQQFYTLATMIYCSVNSTEVIKICKVDKNRIVYLRKYAQCSHHASSWWRPNLEKMQFPLAPFYRPEIFEYFYCYQPVVASLKLEHDAYLSVAPQKRQCANKQITYAQKPYSYCLSIILVVRSRKNIGKVIQHHRGQPVNYQVPHCIITE
jgi:hypothetical protein